MITAYDAPTMVTTSHTVTAQHDNGNYTDKHTTSRERAVWLAAKMMAEDASIVSVNVVSSLTFVR